MKTIYADFNNVDEEGCIRLNSTKTINDIESQNIKLKQGLKVKLTNEELEVEGRLQYSKTEDIWTALINWGEVKKYEYS
jgi:hypothetical protein